MRRLPIAALAALLPIAACTSATPVSYAATDGPYDGLWVGKAEALPSGARRIPCYGQSLPVSMAVQGGVATLDYAMRDGTRFTGPVEAGGVLDIPAGSGRLNGSFIGNVFSGSLDTRGCQRRIALTRGR